MPFFLLPALPAILTTVAVGAGVVGTVAGIDGVINLKEAKSVGRKAERKYDKAKAELTIKQ